MANNLVLSLADRSVAPIPYPFTAQRLEDRQYFDMERAFASNGGIACSAEVLTLLRKRSDQPISRLARWIVAREVVNFTWHSNRMLPMFQFDLATMSLRPSVTAVVQELADVFDDWGMALWFAQPNAWLDDFMPVEIIHTDARAVLDAARADRFVARG